MAKTTKTTRPSEKKGITKPGGKPTKQGGKTKPGGKPINK